LLSGDLPFESPEKALAAQTVGGGPADYGVPDVPLSITARKCRGIAGNATESDRRL